MAAQATDGTAREWYRFVCNKAAAPKEAEIYVYGDIGETFWGDGVSAQAFIDDLKQLDPQAAIALHVNSPGGSAWDGLAIALALIEHPGKVTTHIDGLAASAASLVALAGDEVVTSKYAQAMVHGAMAVALGANAKELREIAAQMDGIDASMAQYYADRTGGSPAEWSRAMAKETWYNADEMLAAGLATRIDTTAVRDEVERAAATAMANTREQFKYLGRTAAPAPAMRVPPSEEGRMADKKSLAESLGLPADASEADIIAATRKALGVEDDPQPKPEGQPDPAAPGGAPEVVQTPPQPEPVPVPAAAKAGSDTVTLDAATYQQLMQNAQMGAQAHATLQAQAHAHAIDGAIDEGKIPLSRRAHYLTLMKADPQGTADLLRQLQPGAAVPLTEVGHCADTTPSASVTEDPRFKAWKVG